MPLLVVCAAAVFTGAFLLFGVQPIIAKSILPWFGGSAAVWTVCMFYFQTLLLAGYLYAHLSVKHLRPRAQTMLHLALLAASLLALPILPDPAWKPAGAEDPVWRILGLLSATVGLPYFALSTTSPLVQAWYSRVSGGRIPYRLFALSNAASVAALLSYPVAVEPFTTGRQQAIAWTLAYVVFAIVTGMLAVRAARSPMPACASAHSPAAATPSPGWRAVLLWTLLAAIPSCLLLAVTNHLCQNVASVPFLWILPLALYLATFILCFDRDGVAQSPVWKWTMGAGLAAMAWGLMNPQAAFKPAVAVFGGGLFAVCMYCHGELVRRKPGAAHLTSFYVAISAGGALGAVFVGLLAPAVFRTYHELPAVIAATALSAVLIEYRKHLITDLAWAALGIGVLVASFARIASFESGARFLDRNFYGVLRIVDNQEPEAGAVRSMVHGIINHGEQIQDERKRRIPTTYYTEDSGAGLALRSLPPGSRRVGLVGLGTGTLAVYAAPGDEFTFYEINPMVIDIARREFSFLRECRGTVRMVAGDARLSLEREPPRGFDVLAVDAFSGDSIPVHLLSREAFQLYFRHLKPEGVLAVHVSNQVLDLAPVVEGVARSLGRHARRVLTERVPERRGFASAWILVTGTGRVFDRPLLASARPIEASRLRIWTDDFSNLVQVLR